MSDIKLFGSQRELFPKHQFLVEVGNGWSAAFQKCSELSQELAKIEYWEGGSTIPYKIPGRSTFADITLERGASTSRSFYNWMNLCMNAAVGVYPTRGVGALEPGYRKDLKIFQLDRDGSMANAPRVWKVRGSWITKFSAGDWDNTADEVVIETLTLCFDYFDLYK